MFTPKSTERSRRRVDARTTIWVAYLIGALALTVAYFLATPATAKLVFWPIIGWSSFAAMIVGIRMHKPEGRGAWYLLAAGLAMLIVGDDLYSVRNFVLHARNLFPSYVDVVYLTMYPLLIVGLSMLVRRRSIQRDRASVVDAAIITCGVGLLAWVILIVPYLRTDMSMMERATSIAYPLADVALLAIVARLAVGSGRRPVAFWLLAASLVSLLAADAIYGYRNLADTWHEHDPIDVGWILFYAGWAAAALHPSMRELSVRAIGSARITRRRLMFVGSAALISPAVLFVQQLLGPVVDGAAIAIVSAALFILVLGRMSGLARKAADERNETRFRALVNNASDAIVVVDDIGTIRYQTPSAERVFGRTSEQLVGHSLGTMLTADDERQLHMLLEREGVTTTIEWRILGVDGEQRDMEIAAADMRSDSDVRGLVLTMRDITERKLLDGELRRQALHDTLTGLPNRSLFHDRVAHALRRASRENLEVAVLFLDLDDFKMVNDSLGHAAGDEVLVAVAARLVSALKAHDTVARFGGDEFAVLLESSNATEASELVAKRIQGALLAPFDVAGEHIPVHVSIGISIGLPGAATPSDLLRDADLAMYVAKRDGKARFEHYAPEMHEHAIRRLEVASELRGAIDNDELVLFYQPIVVTDTGRYLGVEALVRWNHPKRGLVPPLDFIPIAESTGLIIPLGRWVLDQACQQMRIWRRDGLVGEDFYVSVNLSARHLRDPNVVEDVAHALDVAGLPANALLIEVTESALVEDLDPTGAVFTRLKGLGVRLAIDDFGTGYSSLARLSTFPLDVVKIDKSFVDRLTLSADGEATVRAVVALAHTLGMVAVAEGVEEAEQADALAELGCTMSQGFLFARPVPAEALTASLIGGGANLVRSAR
jgi:diguanylate cyclase (GGDEF)-like protein/PAS domain S-box-containing protein